MKKIRLTNNLLALAVYIVGIFSKNVYSNTNNMLEYSYGFSNHSSLKYKKEFNSFDYVNVNAPKQGAVTLSASGLFDKFNPFSLKGEAAPAISFLMFDTLMVSSMDEEASIYGLIADGIKVENNGMNILFHINPNAQFSNKDKIIADDIKFSFETLFSYGTPAFKFLYADIERCSVINNQTISFKLKKNNPEMPILLGGMPIFSPKWLNNKNPKEFSNLTFEQPIASGPYLIDNYYQGRNITYKINPNYWARNHPVRRGMFNFNKIHFETYQDDIAKLEAFKSGAFNVLVEYRAKNWVKSYNGKNFDNKSLIKEEFRHKNGNGMQGFVFNIRKSIFKDIKVREALTLALDFEWMNKQLFYNSYTRLNSYFTNTSYAATIEINSLEKEYLFKAGLNQQDIEKFKLPNTYPSFKSDIGIKNNDFEHKDKEFSALVLRNNLLKAQKLLKEAGWEYKNGALRNKQNKEFIFEILDYGGSLSRVIGAYARNLNKLGIEVKQRTVDAAIYQKRLEKFDFDMISVRFPDTNSPGNELIERFSSKSRNIQGSDNLIGVDNKVIDNILSYIISSKDQKELSASTRALDRILLNEFYIIPHWYSGVHRIGYSSFLQYYKTQFPLFYSAEPWIISTWWAGLDN